MSSTSKGDGDGEGGEETKHPASSEVKNSKTTWIKLSTATKNRLAFSIAFLLVVGPSVPFAVFVCWPMWSSLSPAFLIVTVCFVVLVETLHFLAAFTDPGVIPKGDVEDPDSDSEREVTTVMGRKVYSVYCRTCHIWRPPRTHHCADCDRCIIGFDHHCAWTGNCVGARNYRWFFYFVVSTAVYSTYVMTILSLDLGIKILSGNELGEDSLVDLILLAYSLIVNCLLIGLAGNHCYLMAKGQTTYESLKRKDEVWDKGCYDNFADRLVRPAEPSRLTFANVQEARKAKKHTKQEEVQSGNLGITDDEGIMVISESSIREEECEEH